ncbi:hypothetical protein KVR01_012870 [Diaporthe batatas]|uniref:uncharacterized protein n=1 Tax=Diaporthe batatas TaxID=748121 RepID=UPI001D0434E7|nr:uncharacterized protein KVR01_012870 [Diaporthe batatas]KAG8157162.1 hypothetical protein KVR01_012870 [Diaporthe batatas]
MGSTVANGINANSSLDDLQTDEQRRVLDTVSKVRKCGLDSVLDLPQIVVCGDQSSGKSSVLEALTEIPFPRNDNLCTRFATEISLRREPTNSLDLKIIPGMKRTKSEQEKMKNFSESITDLKELPRIMDKAMSILGISDGQSAFAEDTLSIKIQGPDRPQLTLVDIPGIIQSSTRGVSDADVAMVAGITERYIEQHRTICLAVVSATNDAANQPILQHVRKFDPRGERTLGVITKPDLLSAGSGSESKFLELARNEDVIFNLGWHVIKNRKFEESNFSIDERNLSEKMFFTTSNFKSLPKENVGIDTLRVKLSQLLFEHVKNELPRLEKDIEEALKTAEDELQLLGMPRSTESECREFFADLNLKSFELCRAGVSGHYENAWFKKGKSIVKDCDIPIRRIRAIIQWANTKFADEFRLKGHKYEIQLSESKSTSSKNPKALCKKDALKWVKSVLQRARGTELLGTFNPNMVAELFWEQSEAWEKLSVAHIESVANMCEQFVSAILTSIAPTNIKARVWSSLVAPALQQRSQDALKELDKLLTDVRDFPINYNHYYTDTVHTKRQQRMLEQLGDFVPDDTNCPIWNASAKDVIKTAVNNWGNATTADMEDFSCEEALDCLLAIYQVQQKTFIANITTQVIERHIVRGLHNIFSPMVTLNIPSSKIESMVAEPSVAKRKRDYLTDQTEKLREGKKIFRGISQS